MDQVDNYTRPERQRPSAATTKVGQLADILLADATAGIELVARELGLRDEMRERLRRSLDGLACAQTVVEALRVGFAVDAPDDGIHHEVNLMESSCEQWRGSAENGQQNTAPTLSNGSCSASSAIESQCPRA
ncbi:hypothetical protein [Caballeronia hypogeia]|uniref:hypothetical protein n=1 Tax=Caballeronia hypogeia TaxID=1777140 RepID=UPI0012FD102C|nr:hypothetical protein [Caballeronia hypogeia]